VEFSSGATEVKVPDLVDAIVDITETGSSLRANKLRIVDTLLETNEHLLRHGRGRRPAAVPSDVRITEPVYIEDGVTLEKSTIGPNVSIEFGSKIAGSTIANSILGKGVQVHNAKVLGSVIGDKQVIDGRDVEDAVMDAGELAPAR